MLMVRAGQTLCCIEITHGTALLGLHPTLIIAQQPTLCNVAQPDMPRPPTRGPCERNLLLLCDGQCDVWQFIWQDGKGSQAEEAPAASEAVQEMDEGGPMIDTAGLLAAVERLMQNG